MDDAVKIFHFTLKAYIHLMAKNWMLLFNASCFTDEFENASSSSVDKAVSAGGGFISLEMLLV